jgi:pyruvate/2-oxoglutarate dehydrogenase complex dihydrolipoamide dehydrogenase (E3) component
MCLRDRLEQETDLDVYAVGDCVKPRRIYDAIHEGFVAGRMVGGGVDGPPVEMRERNQRVKEMNRS